MGRMLTTALCLCLAAIGMIFDHRLYLNSNLLQHTRAEEAVRVTMERALIMAKAPMTVRATPTVTPTATPMVTAIIRSPTSASAMRTSRHFRAVQVGSQLYMLH